MLIFTAFLLTKKLMILANITGQQFRENGLSSQKSAAAKQVKIS